MLAGDERAFEAFGDRYTAAVYRFAHGRLRGDRDLTRELVQTTMIKALSKLDTYRGEASLLTWLCACCRFEMLMHFRRQRSAPAEVELADEPGHAHGLPWAAADAEAGLMRQEEAELVHLALDTLPAHYAQALEWKYLGEVQVQEIASRLEVAPKAAESLLTRAREAFRKSYESLRAGRGALDGAAAEEPNHG
jgi:RNA polymerase sigma-70 factor, ECF subfamily